MKRIILTMAMALCLTASFAQQRGGNGNQGGQSKKSSAAQQLPEKSQSTINDYFPSNTVKSVKQDSKQDGKQGYEVKFKEGSTVSFDEKGEWKKVSTNSKSTVPNDMVPDKINDVVSKKYSNQKIKSIEKRSDGGYNVTLASGIALVFSSVLALVSASK